MLKPLKLKKRRNGSESGLSLIELAFAGFVLTVGMLGALILIVTAIATNSRNKFDTTGTMVAQMVIEQINTIPTNSTTTSIPITDCNTASQAGQIWKIAVQGATDPATGTLILGTPNGAALTTSDALGIPQGSIDFIGQTNAAVPAGYAMMYHTCGDVTYDVRWNVTQLTGLTKEIVVSARRGSNRNLRDFALPITLRTISGP